MYIYILSTTFLLNFFSVTMYELRYRMRIYKASLTER